MKTKCLLLAAVALLASAAHAAGTVKVLFIGNSYTYVNNMPDMIRHLAEAAGAEPFEPVLECPGGCTLQRHFDSGADQKLLADKSFQWVVLQEQSQIGGFFPQQAATDSFPAERKLHDLAAGSGAATVLYMTWGRKDGDRSNYPSDTFFTNTNRLKANYETIGHEMRVTVAPVGLAWKTAVEQHANANLWGGDGAHPSVQGSYLTACVFFQVFYHRSAAGNSFKAGLDDTTAHWLQNVAADTVTNYH